MAISILVGQLATIPATVSGQINILTSISSDACDILGMIGPLLGELISEAAFNAILKTIAEVAKPLFDLISDVIGLINQITDIALSIIQSIVDDVLGLVSRIVGVVATVAALVDNVASAVGGLVGALRSAACKGILDVATGVVGSGDISLSSLNDAVSIAGGDIAKSIAGQFALDTAHSVTATANNIAGSLAGDLAGSILSITTKVNSLRIPT